MRRRARRPFYRVAGTIDVSETGADDVAARLQRLHDRTTDPATIKAAQAPVEAAIRRLFEAKGAGQWKPTSDETTARKRARGQRTEPMRASDRLYQSLTNPAAKGAIRRVLRKNTQLRVSSRYPEVVMQAQRGRLATIVDKQGRDEVTAAISRELLR